MYIRHHQECHSVWKHIKKWSFVRVHFVLEASSRGTAKSFFFQCFKNCHLLGLRPLQRTLCPMAAKKAAYVHMSIVNRCYMNFICKFFKLGIKLRWWLGHTKWKYQNSQGSIRTHNLGCASDRNVIQFHTIISITFLLVKFEPQVLILYITCKFLNKEIQLKTDIPFNVFIFMFCTF